MVKLFSTYWWTFVVRGVVALLFGLFALSWPGLSLELLVLSFGIFALLQGVFSLMPGLSKLGKRLYLFLLEGVVGILAGVLTFLGPGIGSMLWPDIATVTMHFIIGFWSVLTGLGEVIGSSRLSGEVKEKWAMTLSGLLRLLLGVILLVRPGSGAVENAWLIGLFAIGFSLLWLFFGFRTRTLSSKE
jgi:uncharacterized membrane protein HdeD (DUF308 family)